MAVKIGEAVCCPLPSYSPWVQLCTPVCGAGWLPEEEVEVRWLRGPQLWRRAARRGLPGHPRQPRQRRDRGRHHQAQAGGRASNYIYCQW